MREPRDIPELYDDDRPLPDSLRPFGASRKRKPPTFVEAMHSVNRTIREFEKAFGNVDPQQLPQSGSVEVQDAFYRGQRLGLERDEGRFAFLEVFVMLVCALTAGIILGLLLPW